MDGMGKARLMWELEKFVVTRLRPLGDWIDAYEFGETLLDMEERFRWMDDWWEWHKYRYRKSWGEWVRFPQLTNHEICHEMFWNAFRGRSKMYIQIQDLRRDEETLSNRLDGGDGAVTLQCSLLTLQMLDYDRMMFGAMNDLNDKEYREAAQTFYRPYLFSYVMELDETKYNALKELQQRTEAESQDGENGVSPYMWLACTFAPDIDVPHISFDGYVVQSASSINKIAAELHIIEDQKTPAKMVRNILDTYILSGSCLKDDKPFIDALAKKMGHDCLSTIDAYKIGNGNCIYAQGKSGTMGFFYDIGFHYRHRPQKIAPGVTYSYSDTMKKIYAQKPSCFILSHWDMDHIAGSAGARKAFLDQDWFAPDCWDACADAQRLAKYLDLKGHLFLAKRPHSGERSGRCIGEVHVKSAPTSPQILATYRFYMGKKAKCDHSLPNCEGIVIEYTDQTTQKTVLMMGDVNYESFNMARNDIHHPIFAKTRIDYLIAPHHGSAHTGYNNITDVASPQRGTLAIICCTNNAGITGKKDRPDANHKKELEKRFGDNVLTTEDASSTDLYIRINL